MFIYDNVNFIFTEISAEFYKNARNREGLARVWGLDRVGRQGTLLCKEINIGYL